MDKAVLLAQLQSLLETAPDFSAYSPSSREYSAWLAKGHALIRRTGDGLRMEAIEFASASDSLHLTTFRDGQVAKVFNLINRAIADLELDAPKLKGQGFDSGEVYDFFKTLLALISSATKSILIIDQYLDEQIFDKYLVGLPAGISVRLLVNAYGSRLKPAVQAFCQQHGASIDIKTSKELHDFITLTIRYC